MIERHSQAPDRPTRCADSRTRAKLSRASSSPPNAPRGPPLSEGGRAWRSSSVWARSSPIGSTAGADGHTDSRLGAVGAIATTPATQTPDSTRTRGRLDQGIEIRAILDVRQVEALGRHGPRDGVKQDEEDSRNQSNGSDLETAPSRVPGRTRPTHCDL